MPSSCKDIRAALAQCLQNSDCIMIQRHTPTECLASPLLETLPMQCQQLKVGFRECRRGMVDMRKRFRGNAPIRTGVEVEVGLDGVVKEVSGAAQGATGTKAGQLYGGRPVFDVREQMGKDAKGETEGLGFDESKTRGL